MIVDQYPFSTADGKVIPLDIIRPSRCLRIPFTGVASPPVDIGVATPILVLRASADCFIGFGVAAAIPSSTPSLNIVYLMASEALVVSPKSPSISVIGDSAAGNLTIQVVEQWAGLGHEGKNIANS